MRIKNPTKFSRRSFAGAALNRTSSSQQLYPANRPCYAADGFGDVKVVFSGHADRSMPQMVGWLFGSM